MWGGGQQPEALTKGTDHQKEIEPKIFGVPKSFQLLLQKTENVGGFIEENSTKLIGLWVY